MRFLIENSIKTYEGATGGKTGYTGKAGRCLVFSAKRGDLELIGALLNCPTWFDTATQLLDWGFENFRAESALAQGQRVASLRVRGGDRPSVDVVAGAPLSTAVPVGRLTRTELSLPEAVDAPVAQGDALGSAALLGGRQVYARCDLVADADVSRRDFSESLRRLIRLWLLRLQP